MREGEGEISRPLSGPLGPGERTSPFSQVSNSQRHKKKSLHDEAKGEEEL